MKPYAFGVDIGGTTIKMGFFSSDGKFIDHWEIPTHTENNGEKVLPDIARSIKKKLKDNSITLDDLEGVGVGVPGPVLSDGVVNKCVNLAFTYQFAYQYTDKHRKELAKYKDWKSLEQYLNSRNILREFVAFAAEKDVAPNEEQIAKSKPLITRLLNAYIVRDVLGDEGFFPLFERDDEITKKAIEVLSK